MISIIAAMTRKRVIGLKGNLPWEIPEEKRLFKQTTIGCAIIMGRKTFESTGILKGRKNIVLTKSVRKISGVTVCRSMPEAIKKAASYRGDTFIIGGAQTFSSGMRFAERMYISYVPGRYKGDAFFPKFNHSQWAVIKRKKYARFDQVIYARV